MFLGVLSRHVHPITWRVQRGVGATCLTAVRRSPRRFEPKEMVVAPPESDGKMSKLRIFLIFDVFIPVTLTLGCEISTRLSRYAKRLLLWQRTGKMENS